VRAALVAAPACVGRSRCGGRVTKPGRTVTVCAGDVFALTDGKEKLVATMPATMMTLYDRAELPA